MITMVVISLDFGNEPDLEESLSVGILQTTLDHTRAWPVPPDSEHGEPVMTAEEAERAQVEIQRGIHWLMSGPSRPQLIVLPELSVARPFIRDIEHISKESGSIVLAGFD